MSTAIPQKSDQAQPVQTERVMVVPTEVFHRLGHFQGFHPDVESYLAELLDPRNISYRPRHEVEEDPSFKQLIPYVVFRHRVPGREDTLFHYTRGKGQGEGRLHSKRSVGIGGHISSQDAETSPPVRSTRIGPYQEGMRRELEEEVLLQTTYQESCIGLINDDETPVGRVHLGVVHLFDVETPDVRSRETDILECGFAPVSRLMADLQRFETWSQIALNALYNQGRK